MGVTAVELLVVLAIITLLAGLLLPAVQNARVSARRTACQNNLRQLSLGVSMYSGIFNQLPAVPQTDRLVTGWQIAIGPYIDNKGLLDLAGRRYDLSNLPYTYRSPPAVLRCSERRYHISDTPQLIEVSNYVFVREGKFSFKIADSPLDATTPWCSGYELQSAVLFSAEGPHDKGFHVAMGGQNGVKYLLDGRLYELQGERE